jgi:hypothetical protein
MKRLGVLVLGAFALAGCGGNDAVNAAAKVRCPAKAAAGWQKLANRLDAPVFCPSWLPDPLDGVIGSRWNNINEVGRDRGYPGRTRVPKCVNADSKKRELIPCFSDAAGTVRAGGRIATVYNVNQDADQWHVLYAWQYRGSLYTVSEHVAPPFGYRKVRQNLDRMLRGLVLVQPTTT